jgi:hypothetical protein
VSGGLLKSTPLSVPATQSRAADLGVSELIPDKGRVSIYVRAIGDPDNKPGCRPSLEVFDKATGRTAVAIGNPNEKTHAEASFPAVTVTDQVVRLNAVSFEDPNLAPCPILLTLVAADGTVLGEERAIVPSGAGAFLDVAFEDPNERVLVRGAAIRVVGGRDQTLCRAFVFSMEVYDGVTGITSVLYSDPEE